MRMAVGTPDLASTLNVAEPPMIGGSGVSVTCVANNVRGTSSHGCHVMADAMLAEMRQKRYAKS